MQIYPYIYQYLPCSARICSVLASCKHRKTPTLQAMTYSGRTALQSHRLNVSPLMVEAWWPGAALPLELGISVVVGGEQQGVELEGSN